MIYVLRFAQFSLQDFEILGYFYLRQQQNRPEHPWQTAHPQSDNPSSNSPFWSRGILMSIFPALVFRVSGYDRSCCLLFQIRFCRYGRIFHNFVLFNYTPFMEFTQDLGLSLSQNPSRFFRPTTQFARCYMSVYTVLFSDPLFCQAVLIYNTAWQRNFALPF